MIKNSQQTASIQKVLIFAVQTPKVAARQVYFLFSIRQMEDILLETLITPVPFSQPYLKGIALWHDNVVPVISLEECLGLESSDHGQDKRMIVLRVPEREFDHRGHHRMMLQVVPPFRMLALPIDCDPVSHDWIPARHLVRGVYEWGNNLLVIAHMEKILDGITDDNRGNKTAL